MLVHHVLLLISLDMDASTGRAKLGVFPKMSLTWAKVWLSLLNLWCHGLFSGQLSKGLSSTLRPVTQGSCTKIRIPWKITYPLWVQTAACSWEHPQLDPTFHFTPYPIIPELGLRVVVRVSLYAVNVYSWGKARIPRRWKCLEKPGVGVRRIHIDLTQDSEQNLRHWFSFQASILPWDLFTHL